MEDSHSRDSGNTVTSQLRELLPISTIYVDKAVHVSNAEALDGVLRRELPLGTESILKECTCEKEGIHNICGGEILHCHPSTCLAVMPHDSIRFHFLVWDFMACFPRIDPLGLKIIYFDTIVVGRGGDLSGIVERSVRNG